MARKRPLVTQYLENISREALERYQGIIKEYIRQRQGIYALYRKGKLYYVGLASNLRSRLKTHLRDRHGQSWDHFSVYLTIGDEHMKELESMLLRIVNPSGNKVKGSFIKAENLRSKLRQDFRQRLKEEEARLLGGGRKPARKTKAKPKKSKATGRRPILAPYVSSAMKIKAKYKGKIYKARVRKDGTISYQGEVYNSPSLVGKAVIGRACNGWKFWKYERSPGDWVNLEHLKR